MVIGRQKEVFLADFSFSSKIIQLDAIRYSKEWGEWLYAFNTALNKFDKSKDECEKLMLENWYEEKFSNNDKSIDEVLPDQKTQ